MLNKIVSLWKKDLNKILLFYKKRRFEGDYFFLYLFSFFILVNIGCYWFAMISAFPSLVFGTTFNYYFKVSFSVGILGALFDSLSFFITLFIIKKAIATTNSTIYIAHLSIDFIIAIIATFWVIFVFIISGWVVSYFETINQSTEFVKLYDHETNINKRADKYINTVNDALINPSKNIQNIYFGAIMGLSAMIPTIIHFTMFLKSFFYSLMQNKY